MSLFRARALRSVQTALRPTGARVSTRSANNQLIAKRFASSGGHGEHQASSDLPWLLAGIAVTVPTCYYLWPSASHADSGHHGSSHGDAHAEEHEEKEEEQEDQEDAPAEKESSNAPSDEDKSSAEDAKDSSEDDSKGGDDGKGEDDGEQESDAKSGGSDKKKDKGKVSADSEGADDTRKVESDSKGASKKRIDSGLAKNLGEGSSSKEEASSTSRKQAGMSNTDTRHSVQIDKDPEKSKKGEGAPETAKLKGSVDPFRPQK